MKVLFIAEKLSGEVIESNCIIQKEMTGGIWILLNINAKWVRVKNETLRIILL